MRKLSRWKRRETTELHRLIAEHAEDNTPERGIRRDWATHSIEWWDGDRRGAIDADAIEDLAEEMLWDGGEHVLSARGGPLPTVPAWALGAFYRRQPDCGCTSPHLRDCHTARVERMKQQVEELDRAGVTPLPPTSLPDQVLGEVLGEVLAPMIESRAALREYRDQQARRFGILPATAAPKVRVTATMTVPRGSWVGGAPVPATPVQLEYQRDVAPAAQQPTDRPCFWCGAVVDDGEGHYHEFRDGKVMRTARALARSGEGPEAAPSAVAAAPGIDRSGPRVFCQSQYDPDD